jgi:hypothetical protein
MSPLDSVRFFSSSKDLLQALNQAQASKTAGENALIAGSYLKQ